MNRTRSVLLGDFGDTRTTGVLPAACGDLRISQHPLTYAALEEVGNVFEKSTPVSLSFCALAFAQRGLVRHFLSFDAGGTVCACAKGIPRAHDPISCASRAPQCVIRKRTSNNSLSLDAVCNGTFILLPFPSPPLPPSLPSLPLSPPSLFTRYAAQHTWT